MYFTFLITAPMSTNMSTNYYLRILPTKEKKEALIKAIENNDFGSIREKYRQMYESPSEFDVENIMNAQYGMLHLGKRAGGWKFLWNPHVYMYVKDVKDGNAVWDIFELYKEYSIKGISEFLHSIPNAYVVSEYSKYDAPVDLSKATDYEETGQYTIDAFMRMADEWGKEYTINNQYQYDSMYWPESNARWHDVFMERHPDAQYYHDYWINDIRMANTTEFS